MVWDGRYKLIVVLASISMFLMFEHVLVQNEIHQLNERIFQMACKFNPTPLKMYKTMYSILLQAF